MVDDLRRIIEAENHLGLSINPSKCELIVLSDDTELQQACLDKFCSIAPDIQLTSLSEATLLGSPLSQSSAETVLKEKLSSLKTMTQRLSEIDAHES